jgi:hypothetical protein
VEIHLEPIHNTNGRLTGFISVERDVTSDELHEHELGELSASMYESLVRKVGVNGKKSLASQSSKTGSPRNFRKSIAKRNRGKVLFKKKT